MVLLGDWVCWCGGARGASGARRAAASASASARRAARAPVRTGCPARLVDTSCCPGAPVTASLSHVSSSGPTCGWCSRLVPLPARGRTSWRAHRRRNSSLLTDSSPIRSSAAGRRHRSALSARSPATTLRATGPSRRRRARAAPGPGTCRALRCAPGAKARRERDGQRRGREHVARAADDETGWAAHSSSSRCDARARRARPADASALAAARTRGRPSVCRCAVAASSSCSAAASASSTDGDGWRSRPCSSRTR